MRDLIHLAAAVRRRHPTLNLDQLAHPPHAPCPPRCSRCHTRHKAPTQPCPCRICHTRHKGACGPHDPSAAGRPGCLACRLADDTARANAVADLGDGIRSPSLEPGGGGGGPASSKYADDDERGGVSTPVERAAEVIDHRDAIALADASMCLDHAVKSLRRTLELRSGAPEATEWVREAVKQTRMAVAALDRFQPTHKAPEATGIPQCPSCWRVGLFSVTRTEGSSYCRRCEDWKRETGKLPPVGVLEAWRDGRRTTTAVVRQAERAERDRTKRKRKKAS